MESSFLTQSTFQTVIPDAPDRVRDILKVTRSKWLPLSVCANNLVVFHIYSPRFNVLIWAGIYLAHSQSHGSASKHLFTDKQIELQ